MEVQTRCNGALNFYKSVKEAYLATKGKRLDKISFDDAEGMHRYRLKRKGVNGIQRVR